MWKNQLLIAYRTLKSDKISTTIQATGLGLGIACAMVMFQMLHHELTFDRVHTDADQLYRITQQTDRKGYVQHAANTPYLLAEQLRAYLETTSPGASIAQIHGPQETLLLLEEDKSVNAPLVLFADEYFFDLFDFGEQQNMLLQGNKQDILQKPNTVLLTQAWAEEHFPNQSPLGQTLRFEDGRALLVTGIVKNPPRNISFPFELIVSFGTFREIYPGIFNKSWNSMTWMGETYIKLPEGTSNAAFNHMLDDFAQTRLPEDFHEASTFRIQPLTDIHTNESYGDGNYYVAPSAMLWVFALLGIVSLAVACVNFINLATAQSFKRAKEIGIRKVLGSKKRQIAIQFYLETTFLTLLSLMIGLVLGQYGLDAINYALSFIQYDLSFNAFSVLIAVVILLMLPLLAGTYPAWLLSKFSPALAMKQKIQVGTGSGASWLRRGLIITQFVFSQCLIVGTLVMAFQMNYFQETDLGFIKDKIVKVRLSNGDSNKAEQLKETLLQQPYVQSVTLLESAPTDNLNSWSEVSLNANSSNVIDARVNIGDADYLETFGLKLIAGDNKLRSFDDRYALHALLVNETLLKALGITDAAAVIGQKVNFYGSWQGEIVGVLKDFHNVSLKEPISPALLFAHAPRQQYAAIRYQGIADAQLLAQLEKQFRSIYPDNTFQYTFLEETIKNLYVLEGLLFDAFQLFALIAIIIGCLGLYGLITFLTALKSQEVGVRKVLGASISSILGIFTWEFIRLMLIAYLIASPLAYFALQEWLAGFTHHITLSPLFFVIGLLISAGITAVTVGARSWKTATLNPVDALRHE